MPKSKGVLVAVLLLAVVGFAFFQVLKYGERLPTPSPEDNLAQVSAPTTGLVLNYDFTGGGANDLSGNGLDGATVGATSVAGVLGDAVNFDGVDDYVSMGSPTALDDLSSMTISFWVKPSVDGYLISKRDSSCSGYWRLAYANGRIELLNTRALNSHSAVSLPNNSWTHVAYTWDGTKNASGTKIYINGVNQTVTTTAGSGTSDAACNMYLGARVGVSELFGGGLDELYIYNRALNATEVSNLYDLASGSLPLPPPGAPTLSLSANPSSVTSGQSSTLSWGSTNATSCAASWTSSTGTSGSQTISLANTTSYSMTCIGSGGSVTQGTTVNVQSSGTQTGSPAELPRVYVDTTMPVQSGQVINVGQGGNLQNAFNSAQPGDTIVLQAGATFTGNFTLPVKSNPNNKWIVVKTSNEAQLPPQGVRVGPSDAVNMPKIVATNNTGFAIQANQGASYYRFVGVEVTDTGASSQFAPTYPDGTKGSYNYGLIELGRGGRDTQLSHLPHHIIFDRSYIHAQPKTSSRRGLALNGAHQAVIDSYVSDFKEVGTDSQAIGGWNGSGPFKIVNNYLEGSGENILLGGAPVSIAGITSGDVEIRRNYLFKPLTWKIGDPSYLGVPWSVKNLLELKNAARVLIEDNVLNGSWTQSQTGWAVIIRDDGDPAGGGYTRDVTMRRNLIYNVGAGINVAASLQQATARINAYENVLDVGLHNGDRRGFQFLRDTKDVSIERNVLSGSNLSIAMVTEGGIFCSFKDNVLARGQYGVFASGKGSGIPALDSGCGANNYTWSGMTMVGAQQPNYPQGTTWVSSESQAPLAAQIRSIVSSATAGAISGNWSGTTPPPPPTPTLALSANPTSITSGQSSTLSWSSTNTTSCSASWTSSTATSGSQSVSPTTNTTYTLTCSGSGGSITGSATVVVTTVTNPIPTLSLTASPTSITSGQSSTLTWSSTNATSCSAPWTSSTSVSGSQSVSPTTSTTYSMTCTGAGGSTSGSATVSVSATSVPPSTKFTSGDRVQTTSALNVRSSGSASGTLLGAQANGSLGTIVSGGQFTDGYYWWQVDYDVAPDGWSVEDFLVDYVPTVPPPPDPEAPTLSLSASPVEISAGQSSTLLWSSTNSSSCSASWTASTATSGSQAVSPSVTTTYSMFCTGAGGSVTDIATVTVVTVTEPPSTPGFSIGDWVETTTKLNIRESSSTNSKRLGAQPSGSRGVLTQGPIPNGGYTWWYVDYAQEPDGWSAGEYLRESSAPGPLGPGARVVTLSNLKVRSEPTTSSSQLGVQKSGSQGTILLGPVSANGYTWWNVDFDSGADGWVAGEYLGR